MPDEDLYDYPGLIAATHTSYSTIYREVRAGRLRQIRVGSRVLFRRADVDAWLRSKALTPAPAEKAI